MISRRSQRPSRLEQRQRTLENLEGVCHAARRAAAVVAQHVLEREREAPPRSSTSMLPVTRRRRSVGDVVELVGVRAGAAVLAAVERRDPLHRRGRRARSRRARSSPPSARASTDFGKTMSPRWTCQRSVTWAGVLPTSLGDLGDHRVVEHARPGRSATTPRWRCRARVGGADVVVGEVGVHLDLVHRRHDVGLGGQPLQVGRLEVGDADRARAAVLLELAPAPSRSRRSRRRTAWAAASGSGTGRRSRGRGRPASCRTPCGRRRARGSRC